MKTLLIAFLKTALGAAILALILGRIFFPQTTEELFIKPARQLPVFGQVLGTTWDSSGNIGPTITDKTVQLADHIETSDLNLNESITDLAHQDNPKQAIHQAVEDQVDAQIKAFNNLPQEVKTKVEEKIRQQIYQQVCQEWTQEPAESE